MRIVSYEPPETGGLHIYDADDRDGNAWLETDSPVTVEP